VPLYFPPLTHTYLVVYTSINSRRVYRSKMPNAHDLLFRCVPMPTLRLSSNDVPAKETDGRALTARPGSRNRRLKHLRVLKQAPGGERHGKVARRTMRALGGACPLIRLDKPMAGFLVWQSGRTRTYSKDGSIVTTLPDRNTSVGCRTAEYLFRRKDLLGARHATHMIGSG